MQQPFDLSAMTRDAATPRDDRSPAPPAATATPAASADATGEPDIFQTVIGAAERNPVLALTAVAAIGAIAAMALMPSRTPPSRLRALERQARRQAADIERGIRRGLDRSGVARGVDELSSALAAWFGNVDLARLEPLGERALSYVERALDRLGPASR